MENFWSDSGPLRVEVLKNFLNAYSAILFVRHKTEFPVSSFISTKNDSRACWSWEQVQTLGSMPRQGSTSFCH